MKEIAKEYESFGVTYDTQKDQWYFNGEKVRFFRDIMTSNGKSLSSGKFRGSIRTFESTDGIIDIYTVRDYGNPDGSGNGTLIAVRKYSQQEFKEHTRTSKEVQESYGTGIVVTD